MDRLSRWYSNLERDRREDRCQLAEYKEGNLDLWSHLNQAERCLVESEVKVELLEEEAQAHH